MSSSSTSAFQDTRRTCQKCNSEYKVLWTSRTLKNPNRKFWKCEHCNDFEWAEDRISVEHTSVEHKIDFLIEEVSKLSVEVAKSSEEIGKLKRLIEEYLQKPQGYDLSKEAEYLTSQGMKNSVHSVSASDEKSDLFGAIVPCPFQQPSSSGGKVSDKVSLPERLHEEAVGSTSFSSNPLKMHLNVDDCMNTQSVPSNCEAVGSTSFSSNPLKMHLNVDNCINTQSVPSNCEVVGSTSFSSNPLKMHLNIDNCMNTQSVPSNCEAVGSTSFSSNPLEMHLNVDNCINTQSVPSNCEVVGSTSFSSNPLEMHLNVDNCINTQSVPSNCYSCTLEFDGASKGNPGQAGAGAVLRAEDGSVVYRVHEGIGIATNNVAEYRAVILGLKIALKKGFKHIRVQGDSKLVVMQIQGLWKINNQNLAVLCKEANELKEKFLSFQINHILRNFNSEADAQANMGIYLKDGEVEEELSMK